MKIKLLVQLGAALISTSAYSADMVITGVIDGPLTGGVPKAVEVFVTHDMSDISTCAIGFAKNGKASEGVYTFEKKAAAAGSYLYIASESEGFSKFFGFAPDMVTGTAGINGDDAVELYCNDTLVDVFGEVGTDGSGTAWEYLDGWAYRQTGTTADGNSFALDHWTFSGTNALDNASDNSSAEKPFPAKSYSQSGSTTPVDGGGDTGGDTGGEGGGDTGGTEGGGDTGGTDSGSAPCYNCSVIAPVADPATFDDEAYYGNATTAINTQQPAENIKQTLSLIISEGQKKLSYAEVWTALTHTDEDPENANNVILLYSGRSMPKMSNGSGTQSSNPDNWNREHVWAKSHGFKSEANEAYTDINHLRPADISINASRGNLDFDNSDAELAEDPKNRIDSDSFEPRDAVKGDVARMLMYMDTRYQGNGDVTPDLVLVNTTTNNGEPQLGRLCRLLEWAKQDPVDSFEQKRNNAIYQYQGNRNPYIDHPEWIAKVYGDAQCDDTASDGNDVPAPAPALGQCGDEATRISAIQGQGASSPMVDNTVVIEGVVTAVNSASNAFFVQEETRHEDGDASTSEGIYVYNRAKLPMPEVGTVVRLMGAVSEYHDKTEITLSEQYSSCGTDQVQPVAVTLPVTSMAALESLEGMLVSFNQELLVTDNSKLGKFGELTLSSQRLFAPTNQHAPGSDAAKALAEANELNRIVLDNAEDVPYGLSASNSVRIGDQVSAVTGVMDYSYNAYHISPTQAPSLIAANARTDAPSLAEGDITVASMNVLNLFNGDGNGEGFPTARGADTKEEYERQLAKTVAAIIASNADVIGLMEIENDGFGDTSAIAELVSHINARLGDGTYAFVSAGDKVGTDAVSVGIIYQVAKVTPVGDVMVNNADIFSRAPMAQQFQLAGSDNRFTLVVNHFRSKICSSSASDDNTDQHDGQGCYNAKRVAQSQELLQWFSNDAMLSEQPNKVLIGDLNAYAKEDPVTTLTSAGFVDLLQKFRADEAYSYVYGGESGYMDHMLVSANMALAAVDANDWHINADEPSVLDYNMESKSAQQLTDYYAADPFRAADHDPVLASFSFKADESADKPQTDDKADNANNGGSLSFLALLLLPLAWLRRTR
ncbi:ExeM/NucH family extracellular endonuclease [Shewanella sp. YIC-542]|uniref:ExeM/NucH family extracellular endonuclease n=1 Tax=Shewanella mytili TaxID=3377111 RepID=UPI00398E53B6